VPFSLPPLSPAFHRRTLAPGRSPARLLAAVVLGLVLLLAGPGPSLAATGVSWAPAAEPEGFARAIGPHNWQFPADFGPHPDYQTEWWYTTGNLEDAQGRPFGFQFTIFRQALAPDAASPGSQAGDAPPSSWRTPQVMSAHFTVSDVANGRFYAQERFSRGSQGLAGASGEPLRVWVGDWTIETPPEGARDPLAPTRLRASADQVAIDLEVRQSQPPVLQGDRGLSQKGPEPGNASYYYSLVQQPTSGRLRVGDQEFQVQGVSWTDHEIFTNSLGPGTVGWDWFSAQFNGGQALMLYRLRREDGTVEGLGGGRWIDHDRQLDLKAEDLQLEPLTTWRSPHSGATYPATWRLQVPKLQLTLQITPQMADQELRTSSATYWEGAERYTGSLAGQPLEGRGYGELTGYADRLDQRMGGR